MVRKAGADDDKRAGGGVLAAYRDSEPVLRRLLRRIAPSSHEIDDIAQETILRALEAEKAREIKEPRAYLFSIARNVVRDALEKKSRSIIDFIEDFGPETDFSTEPDVEESLDERARMLLFWEAVSTLPERCQRVFVLKKVYGYSHQEISRKLGISISTAEKHAAAGLKRCSDFMNDRTKNAVCEPPNKVIAADRTRSGGKQR